MIVERIEAWAQAQPSKTALVHNDHTLTYGEFANAIRAVYGFLAPLAPPPGSVAIVLALDWLSAWLLTMGARSAGLTTVVVPSMEHAASLALRDVACVLVAERERHLAQNAPSTNARLIVVPSRSLAPTAEDAPAPQDGRPLGGYILYTSGTTGAYKKLRIDGGLEDARNEARARVSPFTPDTVFHALDFGLWTGIGFKSPSAVWSVGGCVVIDQTAERFANFFRYGVTHAQTLPESLRALVAAHPHRTAPTDESLMLRVGGGFTPLALAEQARARLSRRLVVGFSATELTAVVMRSEFQSVDDLYWLAPTPGQDVQVVDEEGTPAPPGGEGELRIRLSDLDSHAYLDDEEATARAFRDGFFHPGDLAIMREDGRIRIVGRIADVLNIGGQKRAVGPIEQSLQQSLGVDEVCLFLGMTASGVEELVVAVRSSGPVEKADIEQRLGPSKMFERVRIEVFEDFPRTNTGKTRRIDLRRMVFRD